VNKKMRVFIAISLPDSILRAIGNAQDRFRRSGFDIRWVRREGIHLTLKFLGEVDRPDLEKVPDAMERACMGFSCFSLQGAGVGVFPDLKRPRVIWTGISGDAEILKNLHAKLDSELKGVGFPKETRPFKGHLTLGRVKGPLDKAKFRSALEDLSDFATESFLVDSLVLYQSTLRPQGAVYTRLAVANLAAA